jgi:hypothetical protein
MDEAKTALAGIERAVDLAFDCLRETFDVDPALVGHVALKNVEAHVLPAHASSYELVRGDTFLVPPLVSVAPT